MGKSSNGSANNPKNPEKGFFKFFKAFLDEKNNTNRNVLITTVLGIIVATIINRACTNSSSLRNSIINNHSTVQTFTKDNTKNVTSKIDTVLGKPILIPKKGKVHLNVSSNLDSIGEVLEKRLNNAHIKTNLNHIDIEFSQYPISKLHFEEKGQLAILDTGAVIEFEIKNIGHPFYIYGTSIPEIQKYYSENVKIKLNKEMVAIVSHHINFIYSKLRKCLQDN